MNESALAPLAPRPADVPPEREYAYQRRFGSNTLDAYQGTASVDKRSDDEFSVSMGRASVYRDGKRDHAELRIDIGGGGSTARVILNLNAAGLRDLAARLLDAAHDLESAPAEVLMRASGSTESASS